MLGYFYFIFAVTPQNTTLVQEEFSSIGTLFVIEMNGKNVTIKLKYVIMRQIVIVIVFKFVWFMACNKCISLLLFYVVEIFEESVKSVFRSPQVQKFLNDP